MLTIWGRVSSLNVQKVLWFADELALDYRHVSVGGADGGLDAPEFLARNPHGRIPVIEDGKTSVWESHTILRYLAARYRDGRFWSDDPAARTLPERWMDWAQTALQPDFLGGVFWGYFRTPEALRDAKAIRASLGRRAAHFHLLDRVLSNQDYLGGQSLTLADMPAGALLYRYFELDIERPETPHVAAWYRRLRERPAYRSRVMVPFEELRGRLEF
jgi:glutathione S-transferase